jgi:predicted dienelactone hydrolase
MTFERSQIPTSTIITEAFATYGHKLTELQSMEKLPIIVLPHPIAARPEDEVRAFAQAASEDVINALLHAS